jgi:hypothetical protein
MDADKEWEQYKDKAQLHPYMSEATSIAIRAVKADLEETKQHLDRHCTGNELKFEKMEIKLDSKVSWKHFTWIIGILMIMVMGLLGLIYNKLENVSVQVNNNTASMSYITGILERLVNENK